MKLLFSTIMIIIAVLTFWQILVSFAELPAYILPAPSAVCLALYQQKHAILSHLLPTLAEMICGFTLGILLGVITGTLIAFYRPLHLWFLPLLIISQAIPIFAIAPLLVIWFGFGILSKIIATILMIFFPIVSSFYDGLRRTDAGWLDLAKTMGGKKWRIFWHIRIPAALPHLASGIRIGAVAAPIGAIVGEWVGSSQGLGYLMLNANARMQIDVMFAVLLVIIIVSLTLYFMVDGLLRTLVWWK